MEKQNNPLIIDHFDKTLSGETPGGLPEALKADKNAAAEWEYLKLAVEAVQYAAIHDRVQSVRAAHAISSSKAGKPQGAIVRSIFKNGLRIAAMLVVTLGVASAYKYSSVNAKTVFNKYYTSYDLGTVRGDGTRDSLEEAYKNKDWKKVVGLYNNEASRNAKYYFLAGMADLELHQYPVAIEQFEAVLSENAKNHDNYFKDEAEYFLAFSYLMNNQSGKALQLLSKIRGNKDHLYYPSAEQMSEIDLKILDLKSK
jgi:hypothetical protein